MHLGKFTKPALACGFTMALVAGGAAAAAPAVADSGTSPKNVIVLIGDGMGYNHVDFMNAYTEGETHWQVERGGDKKVIPSGQNVEPTEGWQSWNHLGMSTHWSDGNVYDSEKSWTDFTWNDENPTDSAAAGTAMATGEKTYNSGLGVDVDGNVVENLSERAAELGKSAGVVSSVPFSHATPAAYSAHNESRNNYHEIANEQVTGPLEVIMGAGHPMYNDDHQPLDQANYQYISEEDWTAVASGDSDRTLVETNEDFLALTEGETPERVFGVPQVGSTLQQGRSGDDLNDVVGLDVLTEGALNVLDNNDEGFFLMVEGGAIDWTGHANQSERNLEETLDFDAAVQSTIDWVETNSSWDETLVVVTADHETGHLYGTLEGDYSSIEVDEENPQAAAAQTAAQQAVQIASGGLPIHTWNSTNHTNMLVPFFFQGAGAEELTALGTDLDLVRGHYFDNVDMAQWLLNSAWVPTEAPVEEPPAEEPGEETPGEEPGEDPVTEVPAEEEPPAEGGESVEASPVSSPKQGSLAQTGAETNLMLPIGAAAGALVLAGGALLVVRSRRQAQAD